MKAGEAPASFEKSTPPPPLAQSCCNCAYSCALRIPARCSREATEANAKSEKTDKWLSLPKPKLPSRPAPTEEPAREGGE